jgi:hypothetical protein
MDPACGELRGVAQLATRSGNSGGLPVVLPMDLVVICSDSQSGGKMHSLLDRASRYALKRFEYIWHFQLVHHEPPEGEI